jgi:GLPGLI family protein
LFATVFTINYFFISERTPTIPKFGFHFPDGPYKFSGLPGLIVKIEDADKNYSWELKGNKKIENYSELTYMECTWKRTNVFF